MNTDDEASWYAWEEDRQTHRRELADDVKLVRDLIANDDQLALALVGVVRAFNHEKARRGVGPTAAT